MPSHYPYLLSAAMYPDYSRRPLRVPTWETFDHTTQFTLLRVFTQRHGQICDFQRDLDVYTEQFKLGRVIWPILYHVFADNFRELVAEIKARGLFLFDMWGNVPGCSGHGNWPPRLRIEPGMVEYLEQELGDRFLGIDNGEHDGRYIGKYASAQCPSSPDRLGQYLNFQRLFERYFDDLGNRITSLVSLCFGHYFVKEGNHYLLGAETAQALPNSQIYYAFIRGACKQYGLHWFGNASCFNRWGWKSYEGTGEGVDAVLTPGYRYGPTDGSSLSLLRRLIYSHILYNSVLVGFELNWLNEDEGTKRVIPVPVVDHLPDSITLSPIGEIQAAAVRWVARYGQPGVMHTPVALLLDFMVGWAPPRHLYSRTVFQVWGALPYEAGDYLTHVILSLLYPGYEDSGFYHDERGFLASAPYGDGTDVLLSDAPAWVLRQYSVLVVAGDVNMDAELREKLSRFVEEGGELVITAANARALLPDWRIGDPIPQPAGTAVTWSDGAREEEPFDFLLCPAVLPSNATVLARCGDLPAVAEMRAGKGVMLVLLSPFGLNNTPLTGSHDLPADPVDHPLPAPHVLLRHARRMLDARFRRQMLFTAGDDLHLVVCRRETGEYTVGVFNNHLTAKPLALTSLIGEIATLDELTSDDAGIERKPGYWPTDLQDNAGGVSDTATIAGGDVRVFRVRLRKEALELLPPPAPPARPRNRLLAVPAIPDLKAWILARPTFFHRFSGVKLDWMYLHTRDKGQLVRERGWFDRQQAERITDFSTGMNYYPDLMLLDSPLSRHDTHRLRYEESFAALEDVLEKMEVFGSVQAVISLHQRPDLGFTDAQVEAGFRAGLHRLCQSAARRGITLFLQHHPRRWRGTARQTLEFITTLQQPNLRFALNTGHVILTGETMEEVVALAGDALGMVLCGAPRRDAFGQMYDTHAPLLGSSVDARSLTAFVHLPVILDAVYPDRNTEYLDYRLIWTE